jgi:putative peptidoglycan lipid II flippase
LQAALRFFAGTLFSRMTGVIRDITMAACFGVTPAVAAFMVAYRLANLFRRILGEGALQSAFIPLFEEARLQDGAKAAALFRDLTGALMLTALLLIALSQGVLLVLIRWGGFASDFLPVLRYTALLLPALLFICLAALYSSVHQCLHSFLVPGLSPALGNLVWTLAALLLAGTAPDLAMPWLCLGVAMAYAAQWLLTLITLRKRLTVAPKERQFHSVFTEQVRRLARPLLLGIFGVGAMQLNNALDALFARLADPRGPAYLWYAIRLQQLPLALFGIAIAGALLPPLARARKGGDRPKFAELLHYAISSSNALLLPATFALLGLGFVSLQLLFGRGDFKPEDVVATTRCLWAYAPAIVPSALVMIFAAALYADSNFRITTRASLISVAVNILLNGFFVFALHLSAISIALATSLSSLVNFLLLLRALGPEIPFAYSLLAQSGKTALCSLLACLATLATGYYLCNDPTLLILLDRPMLLPSLHFKEQLLMFASEGFAFLATLLITAHGFKDERLLSWIYFWKPQSALSIKS